MKNPCYRILVVDDEPDMRDGIVELLKEDPEFEIDTACDGEEGLAKLLTNLYAVAIVDLRMPKMDGMEMIRRANEQSINTDVIIITGHGDKNDAVEAIKLQEIVKDWFDKSNINSETLLKRVKRLAEGPSFEEVAEIFAKIPVVDLQANS